MGGLGVGEGGRGAAAVHGGRFGGAGEGAGSGREEEGGMDVGVLVGDGEEGEDVKGDGVRGGVLRGSLEVGGRCCWL